MNGYFVVVVGIVLIFATAITISVLIAINKGLQAGETSVEIQIAGIIRFSVRLSNIHKKKTKSPKKEECSSNSAERS